MLRLERSIHLSSCLGDMLKTPNVSPSQCRPCVQAHAALSKMQQTSTIALCTESLDSSRLLSLWNATPGLYCKTARFALIGLMQVCCVTLWNEQQPLLIFYIECVLKEQDISIACVKLPWWLCFIRLQLSLCIVHHFALADASMCLDYSVNICPE